MERRGRGGDSGDSSSSSRWWRWVAEAVWTQTWRGEGGERRSGVCVDSSPFLCVFLLFLFLLPLVCVVVVRVSVCVRPHYSPPFLSRV